MFLYNWKNKPLTFSRRKLGARKEGKKEREEGKKEQKDWLNKNKERQERNDISSHEQALFDLLAVMRYAFLILIPGNTRSIF